MLQDITFEENLGLDILSEEFIDNLEAIIKLSTEQGRHRIADIAGSLLEAATGSEEGFTYKVTLDRLYSLTMHTNYAGSQWSASMELSERVKRVGTLYYRYSNELKG